MASLLGFHPPQFSEESAWLPIWLQQQNVAPVDEGITRGEAPFEQRVKELQFVRQEIGKEDTTNNSLRDEGGYQSCHLLLSSDENAPLSFAPSDNVVHFHLHLSSNSNSEGIPSPLTDASEIHTLPSNCAVPKKPLETSVALEGKNDQPHVGHSAFLVPCSANARSCNENELVSGKKDVGSSEVDDVSEAVELSIAASEALIIHDIMSELTSKPCPSSTVLQAAIQLKQARLDNWKQNSHCPTLDSDEIDFLSDLDDLTMEDSYENVGLTFVDPCDQHCDDHDVSQVKDTLASENGTPEGNFEYEGTGFNEIGIGKSLDDYGKQIVDEGLEKGMEVKDDSTSEMSCGNTHHKRPCYSTMWLGSVPNDYCNNSTVHYSAQENLQVSALLKVVDYGVGEEDLFEAPVKSSMARSSEVSEKHNKIWDVVPGRFQSRWFGGWTWKQDESCAPMGHGNVQDIFSAFIGETSFFSESADVAPDESSAVEKQAKASTLVAQSNIPSEVICNKLDKETLLSQDVIRCSSQSLIDPLGSVVPCSISCEIICSPANLQTEGGMPTKIGSRETSEDVTEKEKLRTLKMVELDNGEESTVPMIYSRGLYPAVHRQATSLRSYSVMFANPGTTFVKESSRGRFFHPGTKPKSSIMTNLFSNFTDKKNHNDSVENDAVSTIVGLKEKKSTPILDHGVEKFALQDCPMEFLNSENPQQMQSNCQSQNALQVPARKRVHFSEAETNNFKEKKLPKQQAALKSCNISRDTKRLRHTHRSFDSGAQEWRGYQRNFFDKNGKRLMFQNMEFLLTGLSNRKKKKYEVLIRKYGGIVLSDIPSPTDSRENRSSRFSPRILPVVLSSKKQQTIKFLYGCAINAYVLKVDWLTDSILAGSILPPEQYSILPKMIGGRRSRIRKPFSYKGCEPIFDNVGIMVHGKINFCREMRKIIKHGGGRVFQTLQCLVDNLDSKRISMAAIVTENESTTSRHLKHCALEQKIPIMSTSWIIKSLHMGKVVPCKGSLSATKLLDLQACMELSEEI